MIQAALERHWSDIADLEMFHEIYHEDVVVEYPQTGERVVGRAKLWAMREKAPVTFTFTVHRVHGQGNLWITEGVLTVNDQPMRTVTIMEFRDGKVARETTYVGQPWEPPAWRSQWVEKDEKDA